MGISQKVNWEEICVVRWWKIVELLLGEQKKYVLRRYSSAFYQFLASKRTSSHGPLGPSGPYQSQLFRQQKFEFITCRVLRTEYKHLRLWVCETCVIDRGKFILCSNCHRVFLQHYSKQLQHFGFNTMDPTIQIEMCAYQLLTASNLLSWNPTSTFLLPSFWYSKRVTESGSNQVNARDSEPRNECLKYWQRSWRRTTIWYSALRIMLNAGNPQTLGTKIW